MSDLSLVVVSVVSRQGFSREWALSLTILYGEKAAAPEVDGLEDVLCASLGGTAVCVCSGQSLLAQLLRPYSEPQRLSLEWKINSGLKIKVCPSLACLLARSRGLRFY